MAVFDDDTTLPLSPLEAATAGAPRSPLEVYQAALRGMGTAPSAVAPQAPALGLSGFSAPAPAARAPVVPEPALAPWAQYARGLPAEQQARPPAPEAQPQAPAQAPAPGGAPSLERRADESLEQHRARMMARSQGDLGAGWDVGVLGLQQLAGGAAAALGDATGAEGLRDWGVGLYRRKEAEMAPYLEGRTTKLEEIHSVGSAVDWAQFTLGQVAPSMAESVGTALVGAAMGSAVPGAGNVAAGVGGLFAKGAVKKFIAERTALAAADMAKKGIIGEVAEKAADAAAKRALAQTMGAGALMFAGSYVQGVGDVYGEVMDEQGRGDAATAFLAGLPYAALDTVTDLSVLKSVLRGTDGERAMARYARAMLTGAVKEGGAESGQEAVLMLAGLANGKEYDSGEVLLRLGNSFAAGALAGGVLGVGGGRQGPSEAEREAGVLGSLAAVGLAGRAELGQVPAREVATLLSDPQAAMALRADAVVQVEMALRERTPDLAELWRERASKALQAGAEIPVPALWDDTKKQQRRMAAGGVGGDGQGSQVGQGVVQGQGAPEDGGAAALGGSRDPSGAEDRAVSGAVGAGVGAATGAAAAGDGASAPRAAARAGGKVGRAGAGAVGVAQAGVVPENVAWEDALLDEDQVADAQGAVWRRQVIGSQDGQWAKVRVIDQNGEAREQTESMYGLAQRRVQWLTEQIKATPEGEAREALKQQQLLWQRRVADTAPPVAPMPEGPSPEAAKLELDHATKLYGALQDPKKTFHGKRGKANQADLTYLRGLGVSLDSPEAVREALRERDALGRGVPDAVQVAAGTPAGAGLQPGEVAGEVLGGGAAEPVSAPGAAVVVPEPDGVSPDGWQPVGAAEAAVAADAGRGGGGVDGQSQQKTDEASQNRGYRIFRKDGRFLAELNDQESVDRYLKKWGRTVDLVVVPPGVAQEGSNGVIQPPTMAPTGAEPSAGRVAVGTPAASGSVPKPVAEARTELAGDDAGLRPADDARAGGVAKAAAPVRVPHKPAGKHTPAWDRGWKAAKTGQERPEGHTPRRGYDAYQAEAAKLAQAQDVPAPLASGGATPTPGANDALPTPNAPTAGAAVLGENGEVPAATQPGATPATATTPEQPVGQPAGGEVPAPLTGGQAPTAQAEESLDPKKGYYIISDAGKYFAGIDPLNNPKWSDTPKGGRIRAGSGPAGRTLSALRKAGHAVTAVSADAAATLPTPAQPQAPAVAETVAASYEPTAGEVPALKRVWTVYGDRVYVRSADMASDRIQLPMYNADGTRSKSSKGSSLHRDNIDDEQRSKAKAASKQIDAVTKTANVPGGETGFSSKRALLAQMQRLAVDQDEFEVRQTEAGWWAVRKGGQGAPAAATDQDANNAIQGQAPTAQAPAVADAGGQADPVATADQGRSSGDAGELGGQEGDGQAAVVDRAALIERLVAAARVRLNETESSAGIKMRVQHYRDNLMSMDDATLQRIAESRLKGQSPKSAVTEEVAPKPATDSAQDREAKRKAVALSIKGALAKRGWAEEGKAMTRSFATVRKAGDGEGATETFFANFHLGAGLIEVSRGLDSLFTLDLLDSERDVDGLADFIESKTTALAEAERAKNGVKAPKPATDSAQAGADKDAQMEGTETPLARARRVGADVDGQPAAMLSETVMNALAYAEHGLDLLNNLRGYVPARLVPLVEAMAESGVLERVEIDTKTGTTLGAIGQVYYEQRDGGETKTVLRINPVKLANEANAADDAGLMAEVVVHELLHATVVQKQHSTLQDLLKAGNAQAQQLEAIRDRLKHELTWGDVEEDLKDAVRNAVQNVDEMFAWGMSNRQVQQVLESLKSGRKRTLWDEFVAVVRQLLGFDAQVDSALSELLQLGADLLAGRAGPEVTAAPVMPAAQAKGSPSEEVFELDGQLTDWDIKTALLAGKRMHVKRAWEGGGEDRLIWVERAGGERTGWVVRDREEGKALWTRGGNPIMGGFSQGEAVKEAMEMARGAIEGARKAEKPTAPTAKADGAEPETAEEDGIRITKEGIEPKGHKVHPGQYFAYAQRGDGPGSIVEVGHGDTKEEARRMARLGLSERIKEAEARAKPVDRMFGKGAEGKTAAADQNEPTAKADGAEPVQPLKQGNPDGPPLGSAENVNRWVVITDVVNPEVNNRGAMIGRQGRIARYFKGDNEYEIRLDDGTKWRSAVRNVRAVAAPESQATLQAEDQPETQDAEQGQAGDDGVALGEGVSSGAAPRVERAESAGGAAMGIAEGDAGTGGLRHGGGRAADAGRDAGGGDPNPAAVDLGADPSQPFSGNARGAGPSVAAADTRPVGDGEVQAVEGATSEGAVDGGGDGGVGVSAPVADGGDAGGRRRGAAGRGDGLSGVGGDFRAQAADLTREGSWFDTAERNVALIELAARIAAEKRHATPAEQAQLARYVGFGAGEIRNNLFPVLPQWIAEKEPGSRLFPKGVAEYHRLRNKEADGRRWAALAERLDKLPEAWQRSVLRSTQYAHYTSPAVIGSIWRAMSRMGFVGGKVLEPGMGVGHFATLMPQGIYEASHYTGIEFDGPTAAIAKLLLPQQNVLHADFTKRKLPHNFYDAAVGNPPFSSTKVTTDPEYARQELALHDYFFAKTIDRVRPGGLMVFVTSRYTMDKATAKGRRYLAERADLLGAVRLPQTAFRDNAGTDVVTDVLFLRKRKEGEDPAGAPWTELREIESKDKDGVVEGTLKVNEYFADHPDMVLGQTRIGGTGAVDDQGRRINALHPGELVVVSYDTDAGALEQRFAQAVERLPENIYSALDQDAAAVQQQTQVKDFDPKEQREGVLYLGDDGAVLRVESGVGVRLRDVEKLSDKDEAWLRDYVALRDAVQTARFAQLEDAAWKPALRKLNALYKAFRETHGPIMDFRMQTRTTQDDDGETVTTQTRVFKRKRLWRMDYDAPLVLQLEDVREDGSIVKGPFLLDRTVARPLTREIKTPADALAVSLDAKGVLDLADVAQRANLSMDETVDALGDLVYQTPQGRWELADEYLSGYVRDKLAEAREAAKTDARYDRNVAALEKAIPAPLGPQQIGVQLGAGWVPERYVNLFAGELGAGAVSYDARSETWSVEGGNKRSERSAAAEWGNADRSPSEILEAVLNNRSLVVKKTDGDKKTYTDQESSAQVNEIARKMRQRFKTWVWTDAKRTQALLDIYNERLNNIALRRFDGSHLTLPGISLRFNLYPHQKRAIWRVIQSGNTYLAHAVGAGKTMEMIAAGMEQRRLGLIRKPMYVVPNHMLEQFSNEFMETYPLANILVADDENFSKERRQQFVAAAAMNNPDAVVITHSAFKRLGVKDETAAPIRDALLDELRDALSDTPPDERVRRSQLEKQIEAVEQRFDRILQRGQDQVVPFEDIGADFLFVDEAHCFTYDTLVETNLGLIPIGEIVEKQMAVLVKSRASDSTEVEWKPVTQWYNYELQGDLIEVFHEHGSFVCTPNHNIFIGGNYARADSLRNGDLLDVRGGIRSEVHREAREENALLQRILPNREDDDPQDLRALRPGVFVSDEGAGQRREAEILLGSLPNASAIQYARSERGAEETDGANLRQLTEEGRVRPEISGADAPSQPDAQQRDARENAEYVAGNWASSSDAGRERARTNGAATTPGRVDWHVDRTLHQYARDSRGNAWNLQIVQGGSSDSINATRGGDRRGESSFGDWQGAGRQENEGFVSSRVVRIEVLQRGGDGGYRFGGRSHTRVYDICVEGNHNYFANGVLVSNSHRKLDFTTNRKVKGVDPNGSWAAMDLYVKTRYLDGLRPGRAFVMASGTPVTNTVGELYTIQRFFAEAAMRHDGMATFDAWANSFGEVASDFERNAAGKLEPVERFAAFSNVPELMSRVRMFMDVLNSSQLGDLVKRPDLEGGKPSMVLVDPSPELTAYMRDVLNPRLEASKAWKPSKEEPNNPDPVVAIINDARLASIDMRFFRSAVSGETPSKLMVLGDTVAEEYRRSRENVYTDAGGKPEPVKGGGQVVFFNLGLGAQVQRNRGFDARKALTDRIVAGGVPKNKIAWFEDANTDAKKEAIFADMRSGKLAVLIGSAKKMGTGVNVQKRLTGLQYLDPPWYPADVEQPHGRIIRQGNQNPTVRINWFSTKETYEATMWQMVARKQRFIDQALSGDPSLRRIEDISEASQFEMAAALVSGDPRVLQLAEAGRDVERYTRLQEAHSTTQYQLRVKRSSNGSTIEHLRQRIPQLEAASEQVGYHQTFASATIAGQSFGKRGEAGDALVRAFNATVGGWPKPVGGTVPLGELNGGKVALKLKVHVDEKSGKPDGTLISQAGEVTAEHGWRVSALENMQDNGAHIGGVLNWANGLSRQLSDARDKLQELVDEQQAIKRRIGAPFEYALELAEATAKYNQLRQELLDEGKDVPTDDLLDTLAAADMDWEGGGNPGAIAAAPKPASTQGNSVMFSRPVIGPQGRVPAGERPAGLSVGQVQGVVDGFGARLLGAAQDRVQVRVVATQAEAFGPASRDRDGRVRGAWDPQTRTVVLVAEHLGSLEDVRTVLRHELVGHYGLGLLGPADRRAFLEMVLAAAESTRALRRLLAQVEAAEGPGADRLRIAEEVFARVAESGRSDLGAAWDRLLLWLRNKLRALGLIQGRPGLTEMRVMAADIARGIRAGATNQVLTGGNLGVGVKFSGKEQDARLRDMLKVYADERGAPSAAQLAEAVRQYRAVEATIEPGKPLLAPNGKPSNLNREQWILTRTENFKRWFDGSKVVDANGEPLVVYHGTDADIRDFKKTVGNGLLGDGIYFTGSSQEASEFASRGDGSNVLPVYLRLAHPIKSSLGYDVPLDFYQKDYDGVIYSPRSAPVWYVAANSTQVKSAVGNVGTFDRTNPDIRFSVAADGLKADLQAQAAFLEREAKAKGYADVEDLLAKDLDAFMQLAGDWRESHQREGVDGVMMFSRVPDSGDAEYLAAVERGDLEAAQRLVDAAAKAAGYTTEGWHGKRGEWGFTVFNVGSEGGVHFGTMPQARMRAGRGEVRKFWLKMESIARMRDKGQFKSIPKGRDSAIYLNRYEGISTETVLSIPGALLDKMNDAQFRRSVPEAADSYLVRDAWQIKSADPVTRDDNGNVIPLSRRFDATRADVRFSRAPTTADLDDLQQSWWDRAKERLGDTVARLRPVALGALTARQLTEVGEPSLPGMRRWDELRREMDAYRNDLMESSGTFAGEVFAPFVYGGKDRPLWQYLRPRVAAEASALFDLINAATLANVDPSGPHQALSIQLPLGPGWPRQKVEISRETIADLDERMRRYVGGQGPTYDHGGAGWATKDAAQAEKKRLAATAPGQRMRVVQRPDGAWIITSRYVEDAENKNRIPYLMLAKKAVQRLLPVELERQRQRPALLAQWERLSSGTLYDNGGAGWASEDAARAEKGRIDQSEKRPTMVKQRADKAWVVQAYGAQEIYREARDLYKERDRQRFEALVARITGSAVLGEDEKGQLIARMRADYESSVTADGKVKVEPYFPLHRAGQYFVSGVRYQDGADGPAEFFRESGSEDYFPSEKAAWAATRSKGRADLAGYEVRPVEVERGQWKLVEVGTPFFGRYETPAESRAARVALGKDGYTKIRNGKVKEKVRELEGVSEGFIASAVEKLRERQDDDAADILHQLYLQQLHELSQRTHYIHRKGVAGFEESALKAFAHTMFHQAHQIAKMKYEPRLAEQLRVIEENSDEIADADRAGEYLAELKLRHSWAMNPDNAPWTNAVASLGFLWFLVGPSGVLLNLTQTPIVAYPALAAHFDDWGGTGKAMLTALTDVGKGMGMEQIKGYLLGKPHPSLPANLSGDEQRAFADWTKRGARDVTQAHNLAGIGDSDKWNNSPGVARAMGILSSGYHWAEVVNRDVTLLAAYRMARRPGHDIGHAAAVKLADQLAHDAHLDHSNANRARFMQGNVAKALMMFKSYSQGITYFLGRSVWLATRGESPAVKREARQRLAGMLGMSFLFAGTAGLPLLGSFYLTLNLVAALFGDDDEPWDTEAEVRSFLARTLPGPLAQVIDRGAANALTGLDVSSRVSLADLWVREPNRDLDGAGMFQHVTEQILGPVGSMAAAPFTAFDQLREGHTTRALEAMTPKFLRDGIKALRYADEGVTTRRGDPVLASGQDLNAWNLIWVGMGFSPDKVRAAWETTNMLKTYEGRIVDRRRTLQSALAMAIIEGDAEARARVLPQIQRWNATWAGEPALRITPRTVALSVKGRERYSERAKAGVELNPGTEFLRERLGVR